MKFFKKKEKPVSEQELIAGCLAGKRAMQRLLYELHATTMHAVCLRYAATTFEAEDLLHDAFLKVFEHLHTYKFDAPLEAWIRRIVVNNALTHYRKQSRRHELAPIETTGTEADLNVTVAEETADELLELVQRLPDKYRLVLNLHAIEGYSYKEISELLQQPEATTRSQYLRARLLLQNMLAQEPVPHEKRQP